MLESARGVSLGVKPKLKFSNFLGRREIREQLVGRYGLVEGENAYKVYDEIRETIQRIMVDGGGVLDTGDVLTTDLGSIRTLLDFNVTRRNRFTFTTHIPTTFTTEVYTAWKGIANYGTGVIDTDQILEMNPEFFKQAGQPELRTSSSNKIQFFRRGLSRYLNVSVNEGGLNYVNFYLLDSLEDGKFLTGVSSYGNSLRRYAEKFLHENNAEYIISPTSAVKSALYDLCLENGNIRFDDVRCLPPSRASSYSEHKV